MGLDGDKLLIALSKKSGILRTEFTRAILEDVSFLDTEKCPICERYFLQPVMHHWVDSKDGRIHWSIVCSGCNSSLGKLYKGVYPDWNLQLEVGRRWTARDRAFFLQPKRLYPKLLVHF